MLIWGALCAAFLIIEVAIPALVSIWLALAALITLILSFWIPDIMIQTLIFSVLSLIFILAFKPLCKKYTKTKDHLRQEEVKIVSIQKEQEGDFIYEVRYKGGIWTAVSKERYEVGKMVGIKSFEGNKVML